MTHFEGILDDPKLLLRESTWLRRLARGLCSDRGLAEDLSQETLLAAWRARARLRGPVRPWLAGVLRRLAANRSRRDARSRRRESAAAGDRVAPATDEVVVRAALHQQVVGAVMGLDEPYRTAVLLRYYDDLPPRAIAALLGVPVETARTRIKRGIALLRARLDREHGSREAWAGPLLAIGRLASTGVGTTGAGVGAALYALVVMTMTIPLKLAIPVLAGAGLGVFYLFGDSAAPADIDPPQAEAAAAGPRVAAPRATPGLAAATAGTREVAAVPPARIVGRVVRQADGEPVVGGQVRLLPAATGAAMQPADATGALRTAVTGAAGRFELLAELPVDPGGEPAASFDVQVHVPGCIPMGTGAVVASSGRTVDLGECAVRESVTLEGQVRDTEGNPVGGLRVQLGFMSERLAPKETRFHRLSPETGEVVTDAAGRLQDPRPRPAGTYWVRVDEPRYELTQQANAFRELEPGGSLDLVVRRIRDELRGTVVDRAGAPVPGLRVVSGDHGSSAEVQADGTFVLERRGETGSRVHLVVWRDELKLLQSEQAFAWGEQNVRLVVSVGQPLRLHVVQAPDMAPVEHFDLKLQRVGDRSVFSVARPAGESSRSLHPGGVVEVGPLPPGNYRVLLVQQRLSVEREFELRSGQTEHRLVLPESTDLQVTVVDGEGSPVAGTMCELLRRPRPDRPLGLAPSRADAAGGTTDLSLPGFTLRLAGERSDAGGGLRLQVPRIDHLLLRVHGAGHAPLLYQGDLHPRSGRLRLVVAAGARIAGRLDPATVARELQPSLLLRSLDHEGVWFPEPTRFMPDRRSVRADGNFALERIPAGSWEAFLFFGVRGRGGATVAQRRPVGFVRDLRSGESRELDLAAGHLSPAKVSGQVMFRGRPAPLARLDLSGDKIGGFSLFAVFDADPQGRFAGDLVPGSYRIAAVVRDPQTGEDVRCTTAVGLTVAPGAQLTPTLDLVETPR